MLWRRVVLGLILLAVCFVAAFSIPVRAWRTGRMAVSPLAFTAPEALPLHPRRIWIDTDAACGHTPRTDVDDCLALWLLAKSPGLEILGVSTVFGNAPLEVTDRTARELADLLSREQGKSFPVYRGAGEPHAAGRSHATPARDALIRALEGGPVTVVALGPLTNVLQALQARPDLEANVGRLVAVMGRRTGHLFHPAEGKDGGMLFGHGPVFRDFNFSADPQAARGLMALHPRTTFIPYDAARSMEITPTDLRRLTAQGTAAAWIADRSQGWVGYWRVQIGRSGFYPFDALAAAYVRTPPLFRCAKVHAWVGKDPMLFIPFFRPEALLVDQPAKHDALYCPAMEEGLETAMRSWLFSAGLGQSGRFLAYRNRERGEHMKNNQIFPVISLVLIALLLVPAPVLLAQESQGGGESASQGEGSGETATRTETTTTTWYASPVWVTVGIVVLALLIVLIVVASRGERTTVIKS